MADKKALITVLNSALSLFILGGIVSLMGEIYNGQKECFSKASDIAHRYARLFSELQGRAYHALVESPPNLDATFIFNEFKDKKFDELLSDFMDVEKRTDGALATMLQARIEADERQRITPDEVKALLIIRDPLARARKVTELAAQKRTLIEVSIAADVLTDRRGKLRVDEKCSWGDIITSFFASQKTLVHVSWISAAS